LRRVIRVAISQNRRSLVFYYLYVNHAIFNLYLVRAGWFGGGHGDSGSATDVELGAMPRTNKAMSFEFSVAQRAAVVGAEVIDAIKLAVEVNQHHDPVVDLDDFLAGVGDIVGAGSFFEFSRRSGHSLVAYRTSRRLANGHTSAARRERAGLLAFDRLMPDNYTGFHKSATVCIGFTPGGDSPPRHEVRSASGRSA